MKKVLSILLLFAFALSLAACAAPSEPSEPSPNVDFGKKYIVADIKEDETNYYVFNADKTGYHERHYTYLSSVGPEYNYTLSGRASFVWREASDGGIYLFKTDETYNEDHTPNNSLGFSSGPFYFAEDFFAYHVDTQYGGYSRAYIKEGSELEQILAKD